MWEHRSESLLREQGGALLASAEGLIQKGYMKLPSLASESARDPSISNGAPLTIPVPARYEAVA